MIVIERLVGHAHCGFCPDAAGLVVSPEGDGAPVWRVCPRAGCRLTARKETPMADTQASSRLRQSAADARLFIRTREQLMSPAERASWDQVHARIRDAVATSPISPWAVEVYADLFHGLSVAYCRSRDEVERAELDRLLLPVCAWLVEAARVGVR